MVFLRRDKEDAMFNVGTTLGHRTIHKGQVGLEIEVEGNKFPKPAGMSGTHKPIKLPGTEYWSYVHDGSLRGEDNAEYVLSQPIVFDDVPKAVDEIFEKMKTYGSKITDSNRTSVHVHLNVQEFFLPRLAALMGLYFANEEILTEWAGEYRVGNLFCLRAKDAPGIVSQIRRFIQSDMTSPLREGNHYAGFNANAILGKGSVEIRTLRGCKEAEPIKQWVAMLRRLYDLSGEYKSPVEVIDEFSSQGPMAWFNNVFGESVVTLRQGVSMSDDDIRESIYEGIRMAQDVCHCRDWRRIKAVDLQADPFGRHAKSVLRRMANNNDLASIDEYLEPEMEPPYDEEMVQSGPVGLSLNTFAQQVAATSWNTADNPTFNP